MANKVHIFDGIDTSFIEEEILKVRAVVESEEEEEVNEDGSEEGEDEVQVS